MLILAVTITVTMNQMDYQPFPFYQFLACAHKLYKEVESSMHSSKGSCSQVLEELRGGENSNM